MSKYPAILHGCSLALVLAACTPEKADAPAPPPPLPTPAETAPDQAAGSAEEAAGSAEEAAAQGRPEAAAEAAPGEAPAPRDVGSNGASAANKENAGGRASPQKSKGTSLYDLEPGAAAPQSPSPSPTAPKPPIKAPVVIKPELPGLPGVIAPKPPAPPAEKPAPPPKFNMPSAPHVTIQVPAGLKNDLAKDRRMTPWLKKGLAAASRCYTRQNNAKLAGTIVVSIVMHENDRPGASIKSLPGQLSSVFACVTGAMMNKRMPFFTGKEGQRYTAKVHFSP